MSDDVNILDLLRDFQDSGRPERPMTFEDFRFEKARGEGTSIAHLSPGSGFMGRLNTSSYAPTGPNFRGSGNPAVGLKNFPQQFGVPPSTAQVQGQSKYQFQRPIQPSPWIDDVDMESVWYSPMEPVWPFGPPYYTRPREWNYPVGYNLNYVPQRLELNATLRGMRRSWGVLATLIATRQDQLLRLPWTIQYKDSAKKETKTLKDLRKFFKRPDGKNTFGAWARKLMFDLFDIDSATLYMDRGLGGQLRHAEVLDGSTIFPLIDDAGRTPDAPQPAYQQIIYGLPMINLAEDEIVRAIMRPQPDFPLFGYSPIEQCLIEITEAIRKTFYQLEFWRSGSMPEMIITVPDNWTPRQIAQFQGHFDALLSGQLSLKSKVRFVPGGMKPFDIKNASGESLWSQRDETLIRLACFAFSIPPTPFVKQVNRGTAQNAQQTAQEEGLYPLMSWWKDDIMDCIIQEKFGYEDIEQVFLPRPEVDLEKQAKIHQIKIQTGEMTIDEARDENGLEPYENGLGAVPLVYFGSGAVQLKSVVDGTAMLPGAQPSRESNGPKPKSPPPIGGQPQRGAAKPETGSGLDKASKKEVRAAASEAQRNPDSNKKKAGNYKKGHVWVQGLNITIENAKGSMRGEKDRFGRGWQVKMPAPYGYIRGYFSADNMQMDVYLGKHPDAPVVFVIDQDKYDESGGDKGFDEHKVMLGYRRLKPALRDYLLSHFDGLGHERVRSITAISVHDFKQWLKTGDLRRPISEQQVGQVVLRRGDPGLGSIKKADTISTSTGLGWYSQLPAKRKRKRSKRRRSKVGPRWLELTV